MRVRELEDIHWWRPVDTPRPPIHAFLSRRSAATGELSCNSGAKTTHRLQTCVPKPHVAACVFQKLAARAVQRHALYIVGSPLDVDAASRPTPSLHHPLIVTGLSASLLAVTAAIAWVIAPTRKRAATVRVHKLAGPPRWDEATTRPTTRLSRNTFPIVSVEMPVAAIEQHAGWCRPCERLR